MSNDERSLHESEPITAEAPAPPVSPPGAVRKPQSTVSEDLREQALRALRELLDGFQRAAREKKELFEDYKGKRRQEVYLGLVTALLRMVFLLCAEERRLIAMGERAGDGCAAASSLTQLYEELKAEQARAGDALDQRFSAWGRIVRLFRLVHGERGGRLFDPDTYPFLEGRRRGSRLSALAPLTAPSALAPLTAPSALAPEEAPEFPRVSDGVVLRVLDQLLLWRGERLDYEENESVEPLGSVYEGLMGFTLEEAKGESLAVLPNHVVVDLEALLAMKGPARIKHLKAEAGLELSDRAAARVRAAASVGALAEALARRASPEMPGLLPRGTLYLRPGEARRRGGSYYTPPRLTAEVVERALLPVLRRHERAATAEEILALDVCDPAMGSGAFLVAACRMLADHLEAARRRDGSEAAQAAAPPPGESAVFEARQLVAQRCLYGVDLNPLAVDLAKLSLWLLTGAKDLPFTFLDERLLCGDSLLGARVEELGTYPVDAWRRDGAEAKQKAKLKDLIRRCELEKRALGEAGEPRGAEARGLAGTAADALIRQADAWMALWFWPVDVRANASGSAEADGDENATAAARDAPTPATFGEYLRAAASGSGKDRRARVARRIAGERRFLHLELAFPGVFERRDPGFDAVVGNPPWVAYAGRAAQPIEPEVWNAHLRRSPAFHGYRTLHGLFIHRCASLLRAGGRLGLVIPTSVSDLEGYAPTRKAHDALCEADVDLPDFGSDAFDGVFQPAMGLLSTRRATTSAGGAVSGASGVVDVPSGGAPPWSLARSDLDPVTRGLLDRLCARATLPASLFGERGFQTNTEDAAHIRRIDAPEPPYSCPIREGTDIGEYVARPPRHYIDVSAVTGRFRQESEWRAVRLLIRQTARYPIAALSDGAPFRNSILAGFAGEVWSEFMLVCYLNSTPIRWFHYMRNRDARQGMPQVKIGHLRALPAPSAARMVGLAQLDAIGRRAGAASSGISDEERRAVEDAVAEALEMTDEERACVAAWAAANPLPRSGS